MADSVTNAPVAATSASKARRPRFQFSIRTALMLMFLASTFFAGLGWRLNRASHQRRIVAELRELGASVDHKIVSLYEPVGGNNLVPSDEFFVAALLRRTLGDDFVSDVRSVDYLKSIYINPPPATPEDRRRVVELVKKLPRLEWISLNADVTSQDLAGFPSLETVEFLNIAPPRKGSLTDDDLVFLDRCGKLESLLLGDQPFDGSGLDHLRKCRNLRTLLVCRTNFGDDSLIHLSGLTNLETLTLSDTRVTDAGIAKAKLPDSIQSINLSNIAIGDTALKSIEKLPNLLGMSIKETKVTKQGVERFKKARPGCHVFE